MDEPGIDPDYVALLQSDRVSARTRKVLLDRAGAPSGQSVLTPDELTILRAMIARMLPQTGPDTIDVASRLDDALARGMGDGWRNAGLPADLDAYRAGLAALEATPGGFTALDASGQDAVLRRAADGLCHAEHWTGEQMRLWFGDVLADATKIYVAHPATLARMGYSGVGYGAEDPVGFTQLEPGQREAWEPQAHAS